MSQIISRADPHFVVHCLDTLLPQFAVKPYQEDMLKLVKPLCEGLKQVGSVLEANYKFKMDELMNIWTEMCKDNTVDIVVRLRALEVIEIRTFMWKPTQKLRDFYKERIAKFEKVKSDLTRVEPTSSARSSDNESFKSIPGSSASKRPEAERFQTSVRELFPDIRERECVVVEGVKLFISCVSPEILLKAKQVLKDNLVNLKTSSSSNVRYSREDLISLSNSPSVTDTDSPVQWSLIADSCPEILLKDRS